MTKKTLALIIVDGWGLEQRSKESNAFHKAKTPYLDSIMEKNPTTVLEASGLDVGLPQGQMGNSEVGHLNIGAGRIVYQDFTLISKAVEEGTLGQNEVLHEALLDLNKRGGNLHLLGLLSDGGVHSHIRHAKALLKAAREQGVEKVYFHAILDGRDVPPRSAVPFVEDMEREFASQGLGSIATLGGRYYYMDRDKRWDRTELAYKAMVQGEGYTFNQAREAVEKGYERGEDDEFIKPTVLNPQGIVRDDDLILFFNFRSDRARQLTQAFMEREVEHVSASLPRPRVQMLTMTQYHKDFPLPVLFPPQKVEKGLGEILSQEGYRQLRLAETEKYAHVTFFFNGGQEGEYPGEERCLVPSPKVATYDLQPEMHAEKVTDRALEYLTQGNIDIFIMNYANLDMVGHTGDYEAAVQAIETIDSCLQRLVTALLEADVLVLITADHGNVEKMVDDEGKPHTAHTNNPVPLIMLGGKDGKLARGGRLEDIAPTILDLLGLQQPKEMTGSTLLKK